MPSKAQPSAIPSNEQQDQAVTEEDSHRILSPQTSSPAPVGFFARLKQALFAKNEEKTDEALREAIEEYIVEPQSLGGDSVSTHERVLFSNVLELRDIKVVDVMIPRADIAAIDVATPKEDLLLFIAEQQYSRLPVFRGTLDDVIGTIHIKDIVTRMAKGEKVDIESMVTEVPIVSPSLPILDLVLEMRQSSRHMALVIDEFGGIDGLVTIGDVIERIIGEIDDEHDTQEEPQIHESSDGAIQADARVSLHEFEKRYGSMLRSEEREESDTLGGLVFDLAGRVPARGEMITHKSGMVFEVIEADPRRISSLKITNIPLASQIADSAD